MRVALALALALCGSMAQAAPYRAETHSRREQPLLRETARATSQRTVQRPSASHRPLLQAASPTRASAPARDSTRDAPRDLRGQLGQDVSRALPRGAVRILSRAAARPPARQLAVGRSARLKPRPVPLAHAPEPEPVPARVPTRLAEMRTPQEIALSFARTPLAG